MAQRILHFVSLKCFAAACRLPHGGGSCYSVPFVFLGDTFLGAGTLIPRRRAAPLHTIGALVRQRPGPLDPHHPTSGSLRGWPWTTHTAGRRAYSIIGWSQAHGSPSSSSPKMAWDHPITSSIIYSLCSSHWAGDMLLLYKGHNNALRP
jgi:hypothetical protein